MTRLIRTLRRAEARRAGRDWVGQETPHRERADGGYAALHPTKGWREFSIKRLTAQRKLTGMRDAIIRRRLGVVFGA